MARLTTAWYWPVNNTLAGNTEIVRPWNDLYQGIERANLCIDQIPKMEQ